MICFKKTYNRQKKYFIFVFMFCLFSANLFAAPWLKEQKITATDAAPLDQFGISVAISGNRAIVGAHLNDDDGSNSGSAYIFEYDHHLNKWIEKQKLTSLDAANGDQFGYSVAISGKRAIVGARKNDSPKNSGSAYIFEYDQNLNMWMEIQKLTASDAQNGDNFGDSVAISGEIAIVGALNNDDSGSNSGSAYIFEYDRRKDRWIEMQKLIASDAMAGDQFGYSVSMSSKRAIIGALNNDDSGSNSGSAYIFEYDHSKDRWIEKQKLIASDAAASDLFGHSVSISDKRAIVGAKFNDDNGNKSGSAYIFKYDCNLNMWIEIQKLIASDAAAKDQFGNSVAISGEIAIVGAKLSDDSGNNSGSAYIFEYDHSKGRWIEKLKLTALDAAAKDQFGNSVAISGKRAIVGAKFNDDSGDKSGSAYIYKFHLYDGNN